MDKRLIRNIGRLIKSLIFFWLYLPHLLILMGGGIKKIIYSDIEMKKSQIGFDFSLPKAILLIYFLHNDPYFRSWFYYRIGPIKAALISWIRPGDRSFMISYKTKIGKSALFAHPFSTVINAESIGDNFYFIHLTTLGASGNGRPKIGNNVRLGANVTIIGDVTVGNNVIVGAGSIVVKDIPDNCVVAGNPAKIIRYINC